MGVPINLGLWRVARHSGRVLPVGQVTFSIAAAIGGVIVLVMVMTANEGHERPTEVLRTG
jgi:hypothetical protein